MYILLEKIEFFMMGALLKTNSMKISELIERLQELQEEHGDIEVQAYTDNDCHGYYDTFSRENVCYEKIDNVVLIF